MFDNICANTVETKIVILQLVGSVETKRSVFIINYKGYGK
jgi:hypothetical protein